MTERVNRVDMAKGFCAVLVVMRFALGLATGLVVSTAGAVADRPENPFGRAVSGMERIAESCSPFYSVDTESLRRYRAAFASAGRRSLGESAFLAAVEQGRSNRRQELAAAGARAWCLRERAGLLAIGFDDLFPTETLLTGNSLRDSGSLAERTSA